MLAPLWQPLSNSTLTYSVSGKSVACSCLALYLSPWELLWCKLIFGGQHVLKLCKIVSHRSIYKHCCLLPEILAAFWLPSVIKLSRNGNIKFLFNNSAHAWCLTVLTDSNTFIQFGGSRAKKPGWLSCSSSHWPGLWGLGSLQVTVIQMAYSWLGINSLLCLMYG